MAGGTRVAGGIAEGACSEFWDLRINVVRYRRVRIHKLEMSNSVLIVHIEGAGMGGALPRVQCA